METDLETLIVTLAGDGSAFTRMMEQAKLSTQDTVDKVRKGGEDIEKFGDRLKGFASTVMSTLATIGLSIGVFGAFSKFGQYEEGVIRLNAAIEANGGNVKAATAQYLKFAEELERTTMLSRGQVMGMLRQAEAAGLAGEAAQRTTRFATGFAAALDVSAEHSMFLAIAMERGNVHMLRRIPALRGITNEQELLSKAQALATQGLRISNELSQTAAGRLEKLKQSISKLTKDIGGLVADAIDPLIVAAKAAVDWFNRLDPTVRRVVASVLLAIAAIPVMASAWTYLKTVLGMVTTAVGLLKTSLMGLLLNPYALALAAAILVIYGALKMAADAVGGWGKMWDMIWAKVMEFWKWFEPTWNKLKEVGVAAWRAYLAMGKVVWEFLKGAISVVVFWAQELWKWLQQLATSIGLTRMGVDLDNLIELFQKLEFAWTNFQKIATYVWTVIQLRAVMFFNDLVHWYTVQLPELGAWFLNNWIALWTDAVNFSTTVIGNLASNIVSVISNIPGLISGAVRWDEVWRPLTDGFVSALGGLPELTQREMTALEGQLMSEWQTLGAEIDESWEEFRRRRIDEMRREDVAAQDSDTRDQSLTAAKKDRHLKLNAVLSGSAEALARAAEFAETMAAGRETRPGATGGRPGAAPPAAPAHDIGVALRDAFGGSGAIWNRIRDAGVQAWNTVTAWALRKWEEITDTATRFWNGLPIVVFEAWNTSVAYLRGLWDTFMGWLSNNWGAVLAGAIVAGILLPISGPLAILAGLAVTFWPEVIRAVQNVWPVIARFLQDNWVVVLTTMALGFITVVLGPLGPIVAGILALILLFPDQARAMWDSVLAWAINFWNNLPALALQGLMGLGGNILAMFDHLVASIFATWDAIDWDKVLDAAEKFFFETLPDWMVIAIGAVVLVIGGLIESILNGTLLTKIVEFVEGLPAVAETFFGALGPRIQAFIQGVWTRTEAMITNAFNRIVARISGGLIGGEGGPLRGVQENIQRITGGQGGQSTTPVVRELQQLGTTLRGIADRPDQVLSTLGLPRIGG